MKIKDEAVEAAAKAIANAWGETWQCVCAEQRGLDCDCGDAMTDEREPYDERLSREDCRMAARAALAAALPHLSQGAVGVKPLKWTELSTGWIAHTSFHAYEVVKTDHGFMATYANRDFAWGAEDAMKAAAQADFERRIMSALSPAPVGVTDEMVEAAKRIRDTAMEQTMAARIPESGHFGAIAQDADWLVDHLTACQQEVERLTDRAEEAEALLEQMRERLDARERDPVGMQERRRAEAAEARNAELVKALVPFAHIAESYSDQEDDEFQVWTDFDALGATLPLRIFRRARAALGGQSNEA